jgi:hypothetical protein
MRFRLLAFALALAGLPLMPPGPVAAQGPTPSGAEAMLRLASPSSGRPSLLAASDDGSFVLPDSAGRKKKDHTVTGLLIGAGLGFAAGWAFYDLVCEAVNNRCSDSRIRLLIPGTAIGGMLGALIGSLSG